MRLLQASLLLTASLILSGCTVGSTQPAPARWTTGFWFWQGSTIDPAYSGQQLDVLFVQVGTIRKEGLGWVRTAAQWHAYGTLPSELPPAREYWLVWRYDGRGVPDSEVAAILGNEFVRLRDAAHERHLNVAGLQLDIDSPTSALPRYAEFIREVRKRLPDGMRISITALLDWFRDGAGIDAVIAAVDEFVPQFYDIGDPGDAQAAIASRIDAARWGPVFNRFYKRFRIGISSFGRARMVGRGAAEQRRLTFYGDMRPLDVATNPAFRLNASRNPTEETVLSYQALRKVEVAYERLEPGDAVEFVISTPETIRAAVQRARQIKGNMQGVVFFRWPSGREDWAMQPEEALDAAGVTAASQRKEDRVQVISGECAAVRCVDVYLETAGPLSPQAVRYRIRASRPLEYFLPDRNVPARLAGESELDVSLPPYCGRGRLYIGRAVSLEPAEFTVEEER